MSRANRKRSRRTGGLTDELRAVLVANGIRFSNADRNRAKARRRRIRAMGGQA